MDSKKFFTQWRSVAVGSGLTCLAGVFIASAVDKNPVRTAMVGLAAFLLVNAVFLAITFLVDPPRKSGG